MNRLRKILRGFTLVELLVVIVIITILAGLTISTIGYAQQKAARDRTKAEISALEVALESYKIDNGDYPRSLKDTSTVYDSDNLSPINHQNATIADGRYKKASLVLYEALSSDTNHDRQVSTTEKSEGRIYFHFKPGMLYPSTSSAATAPGAVQAVLDPFGNIYGYSTAYNAQLSGTSGTTPANGYNPTFDLWSTNDPKRTGASGTGTWITNW